MVASRLRIRALLDARLPVVVGVLVVLGAVGGWTTYAAFVDAPQTTEQRVVSSWSSNGSFDHEATVTEPNPVFQTGTTLSNRSTYLRTVAPLLNGTFAYRYAGSANGSLNVSTTLVVRSRRVVTDDGTETVLWTNRTVLTRDNATAVPPAQTVRTPFGLNVSLAAARAERRVGGVGNPGGTTRMAVLAVVELDGTVDGHAVDRTERYPLSIRLAGSTYSVTANGSHRRYRTTETVAVRPSPGPLAIISGPLLALLSLGALGAVGLGSRRDRLALSPRERDRLAYRDDRAEFDDWIVRMRPPESVCDRPTVEAETLGDLVDFAIDADTAVIEHPEEGYYVVLHDGFRYVYEPPVVPD